jgi:hypothetical protein
LPGRAKRVFRHLVKSNDNGRIMIS